MPNFVEHEMQASNNRDLVNDLMNMKQGDSSDSPLKYPDWVSTVCFYTAVHVIEAEIFAMTKVHYCYRGNKVVSETINHSSDFKNIFTGSTLPTSAHYYRKLVVEDSRNGYDDKFMDSYGNLFEYSCESRYNCYKKCSKNVLKAQKALKVILDFHKSHYKESNL